MPSGLFTDAVRRDAHGRGPLPHYTSPPEGTSSKGREKDISFTESYGLASCLRFPEATSNGPLRNGFSFRKLNQGSLIESTSAVYYHEVVGLELVVSAIATPSSIVCLECPPQIRCCRSSVGLEVSFVVQFVRHDAR